MEKSNRDPDKIWIELQHECEAMADYAFARGFEVPAELMKLLEKYTEISKKKAVSGDTEVEGVVLNTPASEKGSDRVRAKQLTYLHNRLAAIVAPATPRTILLMALEVEKGSPFLFLGRVPFIRRMMLAAVIALAGLIGISLSPEIDNKHIVQSIFENEGLSLLLVQMLFLCSAALGAAFTALFKANQYLVQGTFDPKYETSYWVRFVVGLISGIILTQLIPLGGIEGAIAADPMVGGDKGNPSIAGMIKITMALLGGFSANLVYNILNRLVETIQGFMNPPLPPDVLEAQIKNTYDAQKIDYRSGLITNAVSLQQKLMAPENQSSEKIQAAMNDYVKSLTSPGEPVPDGQDS